MDIKVPTNTHLTLICLFIRIQKAEFFIFEDILYACVFLKYIFEWVHFIQWIDHFQAIALGICSYKYMHGCSFSHLFYLLSALIISFSSSGSGFNNREWRQKQIEYPLKYFCEDRKKISQLKLLGISFVTFQSLWWIDSAHSADWRSCEKTETRVLAKLTMNCVSWHQCQ